MKGANMKKTLMAFAVAVLLSATAMARDYTPAQQQFFDDTRNGIYDFDVRHDVTGKWRMYRYSSVDVAAQDVAERYYHAFFQADDEIHFLINFAKMTTTRIVYAVGSLYVDTFTYFESEEHDANIMPGGELISSVILDVEPNDYGTAEEVESNEEETKEDPADDKDYSSKKKVKKMQKALKKRGYYSGKKTGELDDATRTAIRKFQASQGMEVTGYVTKELYEALVK